MFASTWVVVDHIPHLDASAMTWFLCREFLEQRRRDDGGFHA